MKNSLSNFLKVADAKHDINFHSIIGHISAHIEIHVVPTAKRDKYM